MLNETTEEDYVSPSWRRRVPASIWVGVATNGLGFVAGSVFFTSPYNARFRGMEPEAMLFLSLGLFATAAGLFVGIPTSIFHLIRRRWVGGLLGLILAFTPLITAMSVAELARMCLGLTWD